MFYQDDYGPNASGARGAFGHIEEWDMAIGLAGPLAILSLVVARTNLGLAC